MNLISIYHINRDIYYNSSTKHITSLVTTEYTYKNDILIHLQLGDDFQAHVANVLSNSLKGNINLNNEKFLSKKIYEHDTAKIITKDMFDKKLSEFDLVQTVIEQEVLEEYCYIDKTNCSDSVQIAIIIKNDILFATIDFKNTSQYNNFVSPMWLTEISLFSQVPL